VARVAVLTPDLLFGSKVQGLLAHAGHDVELVTTAAAARARSATIDVLLVDLGGPDAGGLELPGAVRAGDDARSVRTVATYSHVDADARRRALEAGFDLVVPRSRLMREGADLLAELVGA
jgi:DNA-binding response OmpR family regulator